MDKRNHKTMTKEKRFNLALGTIVGVIVIISLWATRNTTIDDSFISWREGYNLIHNGIFTFNAVGPKSNGASSTFFGLLSTIPVILHLDVVVFFKCISILTIALYLITAYRIPNQTSRIFFILASLGSFAMGVHLWGGLETSLAVLITTNIVMSFLSSNQNKKGERRLIAYCALIVWIRLDFLLLVFALAISNEVERHLSESDGLKKVRTRLEKATLIRKICSQKFFLFGIASYIVELIFLKVFSGNFIPTSIIRKTFNGGVPFAQILGNVVDLGFWAALTMIVLALFAKEKYFRKLGLLFFLFSVPLALIYALSDLQMNFAGRFGYMAFWPLVLGSFHIYSKESKVRISTYIGVWILTATVLNYQSLVQLVTFYPRLENAQGKIGQVLESENRNLIIVGGDAGLISYRAHRARFEDTNGLTTKRVTISILDQANLSPSPKIAVILVSSQPHGGSVMNAQKFLLPWLGMKGFVQRGAYQWDSGYYNQVWLSPALNRELGDEIFKASITSGNLYSSPSSLDFFNFKYWVWTLK